MTDFICICCGKHILYEGCLKHCPEYLDYIKRLNEWKEYGEVMKKYDEV